MTSEPTEEIQSTPEVIDTPTPVVEPEAVAPEPTPEPVAETPPADAPVPEPPVEDAPDAVPTEQPEIPAATTVATAESVEVQAYSVEELRHALQVAQERAAGAGPYPDDYAAQAHRDAVAADPTNDYPRV